MVLQFLVGAGRGPVGQCLGAGFVRGGGGGVDGGDGFFQDGPVFFSERQRCQVRCPASMHRNTWERVRDLVWW